MMPSLNEVDMMMRKASLGAGWSLGLAHDIGEAAAWLCQNGWDGVSAALATIQTKPGTLVSTRSDDRWIIGPAPIGLAGPAALDLVVATFAPVEILLADDPLLFLGLMACISRSSGLDLVATGALSAVICSGTLCGPAKLDPTQSRIMISAGAAHPVETADGSIATSIQPNAANWEIARALAARMLVPATAASRNSGAGPGTPERKPDQ
jgi:hypothetical protein